MKNFTHKVDFLNIFLQTFASIICEICSKKPNTIKILNMQAVLNFAK